MFNSLSPHNTPAGTLPPFEIAKAYAFHMVLMQMEKHMGRSSFELLGEDKAEFIARHVQLQGGGAPGRTMLRTGVVL